MPKRAIVIGLLALATPGGVAAQPMDCFNDEEAPLRSGPANDLQPPAVGRLPAVLQVTDEDVGAVLDAIAEHERRRAAGRGAADDGS